MSNSKPKPKAIDPEVLYPLAEFQRVSGVGRAALRKMRRDGLVVRYVGRNGWIRGRDFIDFVVEHGKTTRTE